MAKARVFRSGNGQAVRLPKEFWFKTSEVEIFRRGDEVVLRETPRSFGQRLYEAVDALPGDLGDLITPDGPPQKRKGL